ncbi:MAG: hypothetical protein JO031_07645 [Ktedonobacteraceae bacterium]|nr:hypothetical protein [Ktedonobacteraceae bacterium]
MDLSDQPTTDLASPEPVSPARDAERRMRRLPPTRHIILLIVAFLAGVLITFAGLFSYILFFANGNTQPAVSPSSSAAAAILVETKTAYMTQVVQKNMNAPGLPGQISNAQVSFTHNGPMVITGNIQIGILGIGTTRQLTLALQPYISSCQLHLHVLRADLQGFPITVFVQAFEGQINSQMQMKVAGLPPGFNYCVTNVHTEPDGLYLTYSATPT